MVRTLARLVLIGSSCLGLACGNASKPRDDGGPGLSGSGGDESTGGAATAGTSGADQDSGETESPVAVAVEIEPLDALLVVKDGEIPPALGYQALGITESGDSFPIQGIWTFDRADLVSLSTDGSAEATGLRGGIGTVSFSSPQHGLEATTSLTVKLHLTDDSDGVDPGVKQAFDDATLPDPSMQILYPFDETVFPRGLRGPVLQWNGGNPGDVYYVHVDGPTFEFEGWSLVPPPSRYEFPRLPEDVWLKLTDSSSGDVNVNVARWDGTQAYLPVSRTWRIAPANLTGTIYYWEVNTGSVVRVRPGDDGPEHFLEAPEGVTCVACHSVSKDGSTIVASFHGGYSPWGTFVAESGSSLFATDEASGFQAISPDGSHVLWRHWSDGAFASTGGLTLSLADSSAPLAVLEPGVGGAPSHPTWSTDGQQVAFALRTDGNGLDFTQSTLWVADVDLVTPGFGNIKQIVPNDPARPTVTYPTFSPDSQWVAFMRATQARTRGAQGELWLSNKDGGALVELARANGLGSTGQVDLNYEPTFLPVSVGGYFWVVFVSERVYGNILTDTNPDTRRKQLWVAAIDANPAPGQDPSHPAFWLPGQELDNQNMRGEWALSPCKQLGESCEAGFECCEGFCLQDAQGFGTCSIPEDACVQVGNACETEADCCDPEAFCIANFCANVVG